jgi:cell wall-associated NlpC family hydrolase
MNIVDYARKYLGVKFQHQGRSPTGCDCLGLVILAATEAGLNCSGDQPTYSHRLDKDTLLNGILKHCDPIDKPEPGCLAVFELSTGQQHVAIVTSIDPVYIIHAYAPIRKVCEHGLPEDDGQMYINKKTLIGYYQWRS